MSSLLRLGLASSSLLTLNHARHLTKVTNRKSLPWDTMLFDYTPTNSHIEFTYRNGAWTSGELVKKPHVELHIMSAVFHYGQALYEGLKAHEGRDGYVRVFQPDNLNAKRMRNGCQRLMMPTVSDEMFNSAIATVVRDNLEYVPPYGHGASLYIRPFMFGSGARLGLGPAPEYKFIVTVIPVGSYYKGGLTGLKGVVIDKYDRCAPNGTGHIKAGGNYAADLVPAFAAKEQGYPIALYLDAVKHEYIEEFSTSNFIAITHDGKYVTPLSKSVLDSVTNRALEQSARDLGLTVERRPVAFSELANFKEVGAVGTAVVLTPVTSITRGDQTFSFPTFNTLKRLRDHVCGIQTGEIPDKHGWLQDI